MQLLSAGNPPSSSATGDHIRQWRAVPGIARRDLDGHQFAIMVHHHIKPESSEPAHPRAAGPFEGAIAADTVIGAD